MPTKIDIEVQGLRELRRGLQADPLMGTAYREAAIAIGQLAEATAARAAPRRTGRLEASIHFGVQKKAKSPIPGWIRVAASAKRRPKKGPGGKRRRNLKWPRGFFYASILDYNPKYGHRGWWTNSMQRVGGHIGPLLSQAARQVERNWGRLTG